MELLASCSLEKSKTFNGKLSLPNEDKKKPDKVFLNVVIDEPFTKEVFNKLSGQEKCVSFAEGNHATWCPDKLKGNVFNLYSFENIKNITPVDGVVDLVDVSNSGYNMRDMLSICNEHPSVRLTGGTILAIEGVRIGRYDSGKEKMSPVFKDIYDSFVEVNLDDLSGLQEIVKKTRVKAESSSNRKSGSKKGTAVKKQPKRLESFSNLFGSSCEEEF